MYHWGRSFTTNSRNLCFLGVWVMTGGGVNGRRWLMSEGSMCGINWWIKWGGVRSKLERWRIAGQGKPGGLAGESDWSEGEWYRLWGVVGECNGLGEELCRMGKWVGLTWVGLAEDRSVEGPRNWRELVVSQFPKTQAGSRKNPGGGLADYSDILALPLSRVSGRAREGDMANPEPCFGIYGFCKWVYWCCTVAIASSASFLKEESEECWWGNRTANIHINREISSRRMNQTCTTRNKWSNNHSRSRSMVVLWHSRRNPGTWVHIPS